MAEDLGKLLDRWEQFERDSPEAARRYLADRPEFAANLELARGRISPPGSDDQLAAVDDKVSADHPTDAASDSDVASTRKLRWVAKCSVCSSDIAAGQTAWWVRSTKAAICATCRPISIAGQSGLQPQLKPETDTATPAELAEIEIAFGRAGGSALREYERKSQRERDEKEKAIAEDRKRREQRKLNRPVIGRVVNAFTPEVVMTPESQDTKAWKQGSEGEERVGQVLDACPGVKALHDRRVPGKKSNIDHLVVGPAGIYVIDAKKYSGAVEKRDRGTLFTADERLYVAGRDHTKLVTAMSKQVEVVRTAIEGLTLTKPVPIHPVLCFVGSEWPLLFRRALRIRGVTVVWPDALRDLVCKPGVLTPTEIDAVTRQLAVALKSA